MDAFSSPSAANSSQFSADDFKDQLKNQLAQAYAEEFLEVSFEDFKRALQMKALDPKIKAFRNLRNELGKRIHLTITMRAKCFDKCITKPGSSLSGSEGSCISRCVERYIEATGIVGRAILRAPH